MSTAKGKNPSQPLKHTLSRLSDFDGEGQHEMENKCYPFGSSADPFLFKTWGFGLSGFGKSTNNDTQIDQTWDQWGGKGYPEINNTYEKVKQKANEQNENNKKN